MTGERAKNHSLIFFFFFPPLDTSVQGVSVVSAAICGVESWSDIHLSIFFSLRVFVRCFNFDFCFCCVSVELFHFLPYMRRR